MTPTTRDLVNSLFDPRSSGMIIMSYIETPKEVYKQRFDLVIKQMNDICRTFNFQERLMRTWDDHNSLLHYTYKLRKPQFTREEIIDFYKILSYHFSVDQVVIDGPHSDPWLWRMPNNRMENCIPVEMKCWVEFHDAYRFYRLCKKGKQSISSLYKQLYSKHSPSMTDEKRFRVFGSGEYGGRYGGATYRRLCCEYMIGCNPGANRCCTIM